MNDTSLVTPHWWDTAKTEFEHQAPGVEAITYEGVGPDGEHLIGLKVHASGSEATASAVGGVLATLRTRVGVRVALGSITQAAGTPDLGPDCPRCGVSWSFCHSQAHRNDARQQAGRRF